MAFTCLKYPYCYLFLTSLTSRAVTLVRPPGQISVVIGGQDLLSAISAICTLIA